MQTWLIQVGMILAGQVSAAADNRYRADESPEFSSSDLPAESLLEFGTPPEHTPPSTAPTTGYPAKPAAEAKRLPNSRTAPSGSNPSQLLKSLARHSSSSQLTGLPLTLNDALAGAGSRAEQSRRIVLYWKLATSVIEYDLALRERAELAAQEEGIRQPSGAWEEARLAAETNLQTKLRTVPALQSRLQTKLGRSGDSTLPLPSDLPHCGAYRTRYAELFGDRADSEAAQLDELLEWEYSSLSWQAGAVESAAEWLKTVSARRSSQSDGSDLLQAYQSFASSRQLFLRAVNDYNNNIARYTELVTPERVNTRRLVDMLIKTNSPRQRSAIERTSAEEPAAIDGSSRRLPRTYAEPGQKPSGGDLKFRVDGERSILVP